MEMEMDFHTLSRRELQALCKKNKIPANITNLAMADALASLHQVEGLEELLNPPESDTEQQLVEKDPCGTPGVAVARTATRMSTRRKPPKQQQDPESSSLLSTRSRRTARKAPDLQEFGGTNLLDTPATTRMRAQAASTRRTAEAVISQDEGDKIDSLLMEKPPVHKVYSTRRSVRMLEKTMADLTLATTTTMEPIKMNELALEIPSEEVMDAGEAHTETILVDNEALLGQNRSGLPGNETEVCGGTLENQAGDNSSEMLAGVEPALLDSDADDNNNHHEVDQTADHSVETAGDGHGAIKMGDNSAVGSYGSASKVENHLDVPSAASAMGDYGEDSPSEGPAASQNLEDGSISQNVMEVPSLPEVQVGSPQQLQSGSPYATSEPPIVLTCNLDQQVPECNPAVTDPELILPTSAKAPEKIQSYAADSEDSNELPQSKSMQTPTFANRTDVVSPVIAGKLSNKKQSPPRKMENILDENKDNMEEAKKTSSKAEEDSMLKQLNEKSLRQLTKMLKEKLQINKTSDDVSERGKRRQALQAIPDNCMAFGKTGEN